MNGLVKAILFVQIILISFEAITATTANVTTNWNIDENCTNCTAYPPSPPNPSPRLQITNILQLNTLTYTVPAGGNPCDFIQYYGNTDHYTYTTATGTISSSNVTYFGGPGLINSGQSIYAYSGNITSGECAGDNFVAFSVFNTADINACIATAPSLPTNPYNETAVSTTLTATGPKCCGTLRGQSVVVLSDP